MTFKLNTIQWNNGNKDKQIIDFYLDGSNYRILFSLHNVNVARNEYKKDISMIYMLIILIGLRIISIQ